MTNQLPVHQREISFEPVDEACFAQDEDEIVRALSKAVEAMIRRRNNPEPQLPVIA